MSFFFRFFKDFACFIAILPAEMSFRQAEIHVIFDIAGVPDNREDKALTAAVLVERKPVGLFGEVILAIKATKWAANATKAVPLEVFQSGFRQGSRCNR
jgi:hypothetical protein